MKIAIHSTFERFTGYRLLNAKRRGVGVFRDLKCFLPALRIRTVLDIGANIGEVTTEYWHQFPDATIHCVEPARASYEGLVRHFRGNGRVNIYHVAFGDKTGSACLSTDGPSDRFRIIDLDESGEMVKMETLDHFLTLTNIEQVDFMKIDTEGFDLAVLQGGKEALRLDRVSVIQVEAGMNPDNELHVPFEAIKSYLESFGYRLFGIYDQVNEFPTSRPYLRRTNSVFVSSSTILANTGIGLGVKS